MPVTKEWTSGYAMWFTAGRWGCNPHHSLWRHWWRKL